MNKFLIVFCFLLSSNLLFAQESKTKEILENYHLANPSDSLFSVKFLPFSTYNDVSKHRLDSIQSRIPLPYNEYVQNYIDIYTNRKQEMGKMLNLGNYYFPIFEKALKAYDLPSELKYLPIIESSLDPHAVSKSGAIGLWQFMYSTAKGYRLTIDEFEDQRKDPTHASNAAAGYFRDAFAKFGDWLLVLASYNCGMGAVSRAIEKAGSNDFWEIRHLLPEQTRNYVPAFIAAVYTLKCAENHDIFAQNQILNLLSDTVLVNNKITFSALAKALNTDEATLSFLNPSYKKKVVFGSSLTTKRVVVPKLAVGNYEAVFEVLNTDSYIEPPLRIPLKKKAAPVKSIKKK